MAHIPKIAVLVSGGGSNLQAIIDAIDDKRLNAEIKIVISSNTKAYALERAKKHGINTHIISKKLFSNPSSEISKIVQDNRIDLIVLAGYLGILSGDILKQYHNRIINIHPALLPKFGGPGMYGHYVHEAVINAKEKESGATVHYVTANIDGGKIILQKKVPVYIGDTTSSLAERVLIEEHTILPEAINLVLHPK
ncbi:MAG: phosphoribosylglycinamide formyltransferase [Mycoplasmataceae bacterium]|jgi:phosphoribosylglycinamide formyltransferase-1|nr:phosphoribosylglycinamide formyltransferase [Mycoplasmataceae bacterium]